jgi:methylmalonyl-CoA mutase C-terminal domain/subunit
MQEDVDVIGVSILSGAHNTVFPRLMELMKKEGLNDVLLTGGGIIPDDDMKTLHEIGVGKLFAPGAKTLEIADYIQDWVKNNRSF